LEDRDSAYITEQGRRPGGGVLAEFIMCSQIVLKEGKEIDLPQLADST
jgi:hypothetical protein